MRTRPNAFSTKAVISSSSVQASLAGAKVLEAGGNVADAAIATSAVLCVTQNNLCGLGGDMFSLIHMNNDNVENLNASGRAFRRATIEHFREKGLSTLPSHGPDAAVTVPGLVSGWMELHRKYATMEVKDLLTPAYRFASNGYPLTQNYSNGIAMSSRFLGGFDEWKRIFMPEGRAPSPGTIFKQKDLAGCLKELMDDGLDSYYRGHFGERIVNGLDGSGSLLSMDDLKEHKATWQEPLRTDFEDHTVFETGPNSQAATAILWLNLIKASGKNLDYYRKNPSEMIKLGFAAYSVRDREITDPDFHKIPDSFFSMEFARDLLSRDWGFSEERRSNDGGDTTYFCLADAEGNSLSVIQSNYMGYGSGVMPKGTGFVLQNRGSYFSLDEKHHNSLQPGKRTFHTLCAGMLLSGSQYEATFGSMGGDIQPQLHIQMLQHLLEDRTDPQSILDAPRWAFPYTIYDKPKEIICESSELENMLSEHFSHERVRNVGFSSQLGHAQIVSLLNGRVVVGAADPRGDGISIPVT